MVCLQTYSLNTLTIRYEFPLHLNLFSIVKNVLGDVLKKILQSFFATVVAFRDHIEQFLI